MTNPDTTKVQEDGLVVNVEKMMEYVAEHKAIANDHFKTKDYPKAIGFYQICLDAINQADGLPMHVDDVLIVMQERSVLNTNIANAYYQQELFRRSVVASTEAVTRDPTNGKAYYWRARGYEALKEYQNALADVEMLNNYDNDLTNEERAAWEDKLKTKQKEYDDTFDDRVEDINQCGLERKRALFEEIVSRNELRNEDLAEEIGAYCTREDASAKGLAAIYQIDEDDAAGLMDWIRISCAMKDEVFQDRGIEL